LVFSGPVVGSSLAHGQKISAIDSGANDGDVVSSTAG